MTEEPKDELTKDEWSMFRKAYQQALIDRGSPSTLMAFQQETESLGGQGQTIAKTIAIPFRILRDGIIITSNQTDLKIPFSKLERVRTNTDTYRIPSTSTVRSWSCVACGAENPSGDRRDERTFLCRSCGRDGRKTLSENAEKIFGPWEP